jgi:hypothetical protein
MAPKTGQRRGRCQPGPFPHFWEAIPLANGYIRLVRPTRRVCKTEIVLPETALGRAAVIGGLVVGGTAAAAMVALFTVFLIETFRVNG